MVGAAAVACQEPRDVPGAAVGEDKAEGGGAEGGSAEGGSAEGGSEVSRLIVDIAIIICCCWCCG